MTLLQAIVELRAAGYSQSAIATEIGCTQGLISQMELGRLRDLSYSLGASLVEFHARVIGTAEKPPHTPQTIVVVVSLDQPLTEHQIRERLARAFGGAA